MIYGDASGDSYGLCLSAEQAGSTFCGKYTGRFPIDSEYDSIWEFVQTDVESGGDLIHHDSCRNGLARHLGFPDWDALVDASKQRVEA